MSVDDRVDRGGGNGDKGGNCHSASGALSEGILTFVYSFDIQLIRNEQET